MPEAALAELQRAAGADAATLLPILIRGAETGPRVHGPSAVGAPSLVHTLIAVDGRLFEELLPTETVPVAGRMEVCLDEQPAPLLGQILTAGGATQVVGTTLVDEGDHILGVALLIWVGPTPNEAALRRVRRRAGLLETLRESMVSVVPAGAETAVAVYDARGVEIHRTAAADTWLAAPAVGRAAEACVSELMADCQPDTAQRTLPGGLVHGTRLAGDAGSSLVLTFERGRTPRSGGLFNLTRIRRHVAVLAALGMTTAEIAKETGRGDETVRSHLSEVYRALGVKGRGGLGYHLKIR